MKVLFRAVSRVWIAASGCLAAASGLVAPVAHADVLPDVDDEFGVVVSQPTRAGDRASTSIAQKSSHPALPGQAPDEHVVRAMPPTEFHNAANSLHPVRGSGDSPQVARIRTVPLGSETGLVTSTSPFGDEVPTTLIHTGEPRAPRLRTDMDHFVPLIMKWIQHP